MVPLVIIGVNLLFMWKKVFYEMLFMIHKILMLFHIWDAALKNRNAG